MKLRVEKSIYELSIDDVIKHEFYNDATLALESAMDSLFGVVVEDGMWLTKPVLLNVPIKKIYYWRVWVVGNEGIVREHTIMIRRSDILSRG